MITSNDGSGALADSSTQRPAETPAAIIGEQDTKSVRDLVS